MTARRQLISEGCQELTHYMAALKHTHKHKERKQKRKVKWSKKKAKRIKHVAETLSERQTVRQTDGQRERGPNHSVSHPTG